MTDTQKNAKKGLIISEPSLPQELLLLPVYERPFFPSQVQPLVVDKEPWGETFQELNNSGDQLIGLCYAGDNEHAVTDAKNFNRMGCIVRLHNISYNNGKIQFIAQGLQRFKIKKWIEKTPPYYIEASYPKEPEGQSKEIKAYAMSLIQAIKELIPLNPLYSEELKNFLNHFNLNEPSPLADFAAAITTAQGRDLQRVLDTVPLLKRMEHVLLLLHKELEVAKLQHELRSEVEEKMSKNQRDFFLKEELKVIQRELGLAKDDRTADIDEFKGRMKKLSPPEHVEKRFSDEIHKLSILESGSAEYGVTRNYLDWVSTIPWGQYSQDKLNLTTAKKTLDQDHAGLDDVKDRILEFLAMGSYRGEMQGSILLLVGPPGVGKTSIGKSIAETLGRQFYRFSLGGMRDEAEIKGHRRTYIGAMPGKLVQALKEVKVANPVVMLDEIDKIGNSYHGDPASALLEALDPEQNSEFLDHYLDMRVDLSKVLFICTANQLDTIPQALLDRMDTIRLAGYLAEEKLKIAKMHLWPKLLERNKVKKSHVKLSDAAIKVLIEGHARQAGVRYLEKLLQKILRKSVVKLLKGAKSVTITGKNLDEFVGQALWRDESLMQGVGIVTGLAWTSMGGATLPIEATSVHKQSQGLKLTGRLGDVMKESANIAYSYAFSNAEKYGVNKDFFKDHCLHVHVPEGATPKDGPSAGVTITTAILSLALGKSIRKNFAMTGEITLTGKVLPVGGIKEKMIAAKRLGLKEIMIPEANRRDYNELNENIKKGVTVYFANRYQDVFDCVFK